MIGKERRDGGEGEERGLRKGAERDRDRENIYIYSILHILTIVFPDTRNVKYLPIFNGSYSMLSVFFLVGMRVVLNVFLVLKKIIYI